MARFKSEAAFACHAGVAPIPVWSGNTEGQMRLSRSGNRQLNAAIHRIAVTQIRMQGSQGHAYYQRLTASGKATAQPGAASNAASRAPCSTDSATTTKPETKPYNPRPLDIGAIARE